MPMHYRHSEDGVKRCYCPKCKWVGWLHLTDEYTPTEGGESFQVCPKCATEEPVMPDQDTPRQTYFGLAVHRERYVRESEIRALPFFEFWRASSAGSTMVQEGGDLLIHLSDWEAFSELFIRTGKHRFQLC